MSTTRICIDIETLGTRPGAAILSVGAAVCAGTVAGTRKLFFGYCRLDSCIEAGLHIEPETVEWWLGRKGECRAMVAKSGRRAITLREMLRNFSEFIGRTERVARQYMGSTALEIWANSPSFDCVLLKAAYDGLGMPTPWNFRCERDMRTLKAMVPSLLKSAPPTMIPLPAHVAHYDALRDARFLDHCVDAGALHP